MNTHPEGFSPFVQERIGWYVYLLRDPRTGQVFYVGKGKGNRVFQHAKDALDSPEVISDKIGQIRAIHASGLAVGAEILRHSIESERQAYVVEASVIDAFRAMGWELVNKVLGHNVELYGWASADVVSSIYDAPPLPAITEPLVFFKIPQLWTPAMNARDLFETTRGWWKVGERVSRARYAIAVNRGVTRAAYRVDYWRERVPGDRDYVSDEHPARIGFWGQPAPERNYLVNRSIKDLKQAAGNPVVYLNCDLSRPVLTPVLRDGEAVAAALKEVSDAPEPSSDPSS